MRRILAFGFGAVLAVSLIWLGRIRWQEHVSIGYNGEAVQIAVGMTDTDIFSAAANITGGTEANGTTPELPELMAMDIDALCQVNGDVIGWIRIPNTDIDYPLLQGQDNDYYLDHSWNNKPNAAGAIFMEMENSADLSDFNTIIYGHNMRSGAMFGSLKKYRSQAYADEHPHIYILHDKCVLRYDIFAVHTVRLGTVTYAMRLGEEDRAEYIEFALENSEIKTDVKPAASNSIITLSTCTGDPDTRLVVQGVLNEAESCYGGMAEG